MNDTLYTEEFKEIHSTFIDHEIEPQEVLFDQSEQSHDKIKESRFPDLSILGRLEFTEQSRYRSDELLVSALTRPPQESFEVRITSLQSCVVAKRLQKR